VAAVTVVHVGRQQFAGSCAAGADDEFAYAEMPTSPAAPAALGLSVGCPRRHRQPTAMRIVRSSSPRRSRTEMRSGPRSREH
jgi:hypothetical protein